MATKQSLINTHKLVVIIFLTTQCATSKYIDAITPNQPLKDGDVLVSVQNTFALGFFSPGSSRSRYVGVWYHKLPIRTVVWVANRDNPIKDTTGVLSVDPRRGLVIHGNDNNNKNNNNESLRWSSDVSVDENDNLIANLSDFGNLVLRKGSEVIWQSFDHPSDTQLPCMKLGSNRKTGSNRSLTCWKAPDDPGTGNCSYGFDTAGDPQIFARKDGVPVWRSGSWAGDGWSGAPDMSRPDMLVKRYVHNEDEVSFTVEYSDVNAPITSRFVINESGEVSLVVWDQQSQQWTTFWNAFADVCDRYGRCGANGICDPDNAMEFECTCLPGYEPRSSGSWQLRDVSGGCVRRQGACQNGEGFVKVERTKLPDTANTVIEMVSSNKACERRCLADCNCTAYTWVNETQGTDTGCLMWHGDLLDTRTFPGVGSDLYIRVDDVTFAEYSKKSKHSIGKVDQLEISLFLLAGFFIFLFLACRLAKKIKKGLTEKEDSNLFINDITSPNHVEAEELEESRKESDIPSFDLKTIATATANFSADNKLGQGGFGSVYKGVLSNGEEIAVKRLSKGSGQGNKEFKNEVMVIARLQHRNLVRILGCCFQREEKMLIYEYLPNKSLDFFIFDATKRQMMDWKMRYEIICGVARGILYLHQDSRLRIIHRDLKASNVLLDATMNPKISDFGLARIFGSDQSEACTNRPVGTYGYMAPEYAMGGLFSLKSDVYSFGVVLLEIIIGRKNTSYCHEKPNSNLVGRIWDLWKEGKVLEIVDSSLFDGSSGREEGLRRCIQIGLLCVEENPRDRPTMSTVVSMLGNDLALPSPNQPAFICKKNQTTDSENYAAYSDQVPHSINLVTCSVVEAR